MQSLTNFTIVKTTDAHLNEILSWLEIEHSQDGEGFWSNRNIIASAAAEGEMAVVLDGPTPVGFSVGKYGMDIVSVKKEYRGRGAGSLLFNHNLKAARADGVPALRAECSPHSSLQFWLKHGFEHYANSRGMYVNPLVRCRLEYKLELPREGTPCQVMVGFWPEESLYDENSPAPGFEVYNANGVRTLDGTVHLDKRCIGLRDWDGQGDLAIGIAINGERLCFTKAKYTEAANMGLKRHSYEGDFYIDRILPFDRSE